MKSNINKEESMTAKKNRFLAGAAAVAAGAVLCCGLVSPAQGKGSDLHLCQFVPGDDVAQAIHGRIIKVEAAQGKCIYTVASPDENAFTRVFVVNQYEASEYEGLRAALEGEVSRVDGLGDEAALAYDSAMQRYSLLAVKRGQVALQIAGDDKDQVRQVAQAALEKFVTR